MIPAELYPSEKFRDFPLLRLRIRSQLAPNANLPTYLGSTWRGLIGWELAKLVCPFDRRPDCKTCIIREHCPYFLLFEHQTDQPGMAEAPRGYILFPLPPDENGIHELHVTLIGDCVRFMPALAKAMFDAQKRGLGVERHRYKILEMDEELPGGEFKPLISCSDGYFMLSGPHSLKDWLNRNGTNPESCKIYFATPVRLRQKGKYMGKMDWIFFFSSVARRLESLNSLFHNGDTFGKDVWERIQAGFSDYGEIENHLTWKEYSRFSNRQKQKVPMGGLAGNAIHHSPSAWFQEWWKIAELIHVGKGAAMGLGKIFYMEG